MSHRMLPPGYRSGSTTVVSGRTYSANLGSYVDASVPQDADELDANDWVRAAPNGSGTTAQRPSPKNSSLGAPMWFLDTTLGYVIVWDGVTWRNPASGAAV